ncbi:radical SAM protein [Streptomyces sp. JV176]|uniref:B12-binding domain-containing radical SAM protein n=1 Tax=Streptomyces sp. JV176 TaxID=858630 RepID=UPI002E78A9E4|nr:radical SAM protein [Streptomyces sp. JV176]MEE1804733.1 radical SAM protein [Streptomyces sp. JV176]
MSAVRLTNGADAGASTAPPAAPHLTTFTLQAILDRAGIDCVTYPIERIWRNGGPGDGRGEGPGEESATVREPPEPGGDFDAILLSTTFIWDRRTLGRAVTWASLRFPDTPLVLGGQYSNLKFQQILADHPGVRFIVRGDAEESLPALLRALRTGGDIGAIPNLVWRDGDTGRIRLTSVKYADLEGLPSPTLDGAYPVVPYESMRGCPFSCKYCSFPAASPKWRYKSARKIADDWARYRDDNGAQYIKALDSTFTVPPTRLRALLPMLAETKLEWEAYTRANSLRDRSVIDALEAAHCRALSIGFESMNDTTLGYMNKKVTARANRTAFELLSGSSIHHWISFIVGYPGETPELYEDTRQFLVSEYEGEFGLYPFMLNDETMPVWQDAERFGLEVFDPEGESERWTHHGMDSDTAHRLRLDTLRDVRWKNDRAIARVWQHAYDSPLLPDRSAARNRVVEKLVDRLGMLGADFTDPAETARRQPALLAQLAEQGVSATAE